MAEHVALAPFEASSGPRTARIAFVAEAWGETEQTLRRPLVGNAGLEFASLLHESDIVTELPPKYPGRELASWWDRQDVFLTNLIAGRPTPSSNDFVALCGSKAEVGGKTYTYPPIHLGKYLRPEYLGELDRLAQELREVAPCVVVALGGKAAWALLRDARISKTRGATAPSTLVPSLKVLPTYHPSYLFQMWSDRPIVLADLAKAKRESAFAEFRRPERTVIVNPSLQEIDAWVSETLANRPPLLSCDIETTGGQIESIGFARSRSEALVVPFIVRSPIVRSYWNSVTEECAAREQCQRLLASGIPLLGQNFLYDMQYLLRENFKLANVAQDTMLRHHVLFPELEKGLGFLGSCYTNEPAWKLMRNRPKEEELKRDE